MIQNKRSITLIAAMNENRVIGAGNSIPWNIPGEQRRFRDLTMGKPLIMGMKTYESLPRELPGRKLIVLSSGAADVEEQGIHFVSSIAKALTVAARECSMEIVVGGGQKVYEEFMPLADRIHLTCVPGAQDGDAYFPEIDQELFKLVEEERVGGDIAYWVRIFERA